MASMLEVRAHWPSKLKWGKPCHLQLTPMQASLGLVLTLLVAAGTYLLAAEVPLIRTTAYASRINLPVQPSRTKVSNSKPGYYKSERLGVTHCRLKGVINEEDVTLHIWLRLAPPSVRVAHRGHNMTVKGFAFMESAYSIKSFQMQLSQAPSLVNFSDVMYIRSPQSRARYNLTVTSPWHPPPEFIANITGSATLPARTLLSSNQLRNDRGRHLTVWDKVTGTAGTATTTNATAAPAKWLWTSSHVIEVKGNFELQPDDLLSVDFELRAEGFDWHCPVTLDPPSFPLHKPKEGWKHYDRSTRSAATQVTFLLSGFQINNISRFAHLLWHNMAWHETLSIRHYILYTTAYLSPLLSDPLIKALVGSGRLHVVLYTDLPKHESLPFKPTKHDNYCVQTLVYNHMLLLLWGSDTLGIVADVDEYIITSKPMNIIDVYNWCQIDKTPQTRRLPQAGMQINRVFALCAAGNPLCDPSKPQAPLFYDASPPALVKSGAQPHPLHALTMASNMTQPPFTMRQSHETKAIMDPGLTQEMHVHYGQAVNGSRMAWGMPQCVRLLHVWDLYRVRPHPLLAPVAKSDLAKWWWPVQTISGKSQ